MVQPICERVQTLSQTNGSSVQVEPTDRAGHVSEVDWDMNQTKNMYKIDHTNIDDVRINVPIL